jgi:MFS family permease
VLLGGVFTEYFGWEWVFYVNVPIGLIAIALAPRLLHESRVDDAVRNFDVAGAISVTASLSLLVYTLVETDTNHWLSVTTLALFAVSAVLLVIFVAIEMRTAHPLLPLSIFRLRTLTGANVVGFLLGASLFSMFFLLALYMQSPAGLGYSPLRSGFGYLLVAISIIVSAGASQVIVTKIGVPKVMGGGLVLLIAGLLWFTQVSPHGTYLVDLAPGFLLAGLGLGFSFIPMTIAALEGITDREAGLASGLINTSQQIGGALGVALLTTVLTNYTESHGGPNASPSVFTDGLSRAFLVGAVLAVIALVANLWLVRAAVPEAPVAAVGGHVE